MDDVKLLKILEKDPRISTKDLADILDESENNIEMHVLSMGISSSSRRRPMPFSAGAHPGTVLHLTARTPAFRSRP